MKVVWMLALFPTTLGIGTVALWWRNSNWPLRINADGVTLHRRRRVAWSSITQIGLSRSYLDGHVCEMRIHHHGTVSRIPVRGLRDGEAVAGAILTFKRARRPNRDLREMGPPQTDVAGLDHCADPDMPDASRAAHARGLSRS